MSRSDRDRLFDILDAITAINEHVARGPLSDGLVFDAVRARLIEIGEAVKDIDEGLLATQPQIPWTNIAGMRNQLAHRFKPRRLHHTNNGSGATVGALRDRTPVVSRAVVSTKSDRIASNEV